MFPYGGGLAGFGGFGGYGGFGFQGGYGGYDYDDGYDDYYGDEYPDDGYEDGYYDQFMGGLAGFRPTTSDRSNRDGAFRSGGGFGSTTRDPFYSFFASSHSEHGPQRSDARDPGSSFSNRYGRRDTAEDAFSNPRHERPHRRSRPPRERDTGRSHRDFDVMKDFGRMNLGGSSGHRSRHGNRRGPIDDRDEWEDYLPGEQDFFMSGALPNPSRPHSPRILHDPDTYFGLSNRIPDPALSDNTYADLLDPDWEAQMEQRLSGGANRRRDGRGERRGGEGNGSDSRFGGFQRRMEDTFSWRFGRPSRRDEFFGDRQRRPY